MKIKNYIIEHANFDYNKYWKWREQYFTSKSALIRFILVLKMKKIERRDGASIALPSRIDGNNFASPPVLGHGLLGIVIASGAKIGSNVFISHQVTIGRSRNGVPTIGNDVYIGPGAKIFGDIKIGNNVRIGANAIVFESIPDNSTVVLPKPRVIIKNKDYNYYVYDPNK